MLSASFSESGWVMNWASTICSFPSSGATIWSAANNKPKWKPVSAVFYILLLMEIFLCFFSDQPWFHVNKFSLLPCNWIFLPSAFHTLLHSSRLVFRSRAWFVCNAVSFRFVLTFQNSDWKVLDRSNIFARIGVWDVFECLFFSMSVLLFVKLKVSTIFLIHRVWGGLPTVQKIIILRSPSDAYFPI